MRLKAIFNNEYSLGYPVNREHAFKIDLKLLGLIENSLSTTYLNNIASPYYHGGYTTDNVKDLEVELMNKLAVHFNLPVENSFGYVTYGGTEANFVSIWWHRNFLLKHTKKQPVLLTSSKSHYSLKKIADQLQIEIVNIEADYNGINYAYLEEVVKQINRPIIYSMNFGATTDGSIDDVFKIYQILSKYNTNFKIHGDGAIYGLMIPYMKQYAEIDTIFDYIDTLSFSGHKFLGAYNISGVVLTKKSYLNKVFAEESRKINYVQNAIDITSSGSRQGYFSIELYLLITEALSIENNKTKLQILWQECLNNAEWFLNELLKIVSVKELHYHSNQLSIILPAPLELAKKDFLGKKYGLMPIEGNKLGIYVFPRSTRNKLKAFLKDYQESIE